MDKMEYKKLSKSYRHKNANYKIDVHLHHSGDDSHIAFLYLERQLAPMSNEKCSTDKLESAIETLKVKVKEIIDKSPELYKEKKVETDKAYNKVKEMGFNW